MKKAHGESLGVSGVKDLNMPSDIFPHRNSSPGSHEPLCSNGRLAALKPAGLHFQSMLGVDPPNRIRNKLTRQTTSTYTAAVHARLGVPDVPPSIMPPGAMNVTCTQARVIIAAMVAGSLVLNVQGIDRTPLWNDEAFSFFAAHDGLRHTIDFISNDTQPPFYYLVLSLWLKLGASVFVIRALSAVAVSLTIVSLYGAARRLFNVQTALLASLLFAIAPLSVTWAQKARPYPLQTLLVAVAFWGFARVFHAPEARRRCIGAGLAAVIRRRNVRRAALDLGWIAYAAAGALAMLAQEPAGFFILGCNVAMAIEIGRKPKAHRVLLANWVCAQAILIVIWALWAPVFIHQIGQHLTADQIARKHAIFLVTWPQVVATLGGLFGIAGMSSGVAVITALYAVIVAVACIRIPRRQPHAWILPVIILAPVMACLAGFFLIHPVFGYVISTFAWMLVPYTMLVAFGVVSIRPVAIRSTVLAIVLAGNAWGVRNVLQYDTPPLDRIAATIAAAQQPGDGLILSTKASGRWGIAYYLGPPYEGRLAGLSVQDWDETRLVRTPAETATLQGVWTVLLPDETAAVDLAALPRHLHPAFSATIGQFRIQRYDACTVAC